MKLAKIVVSSLFSIATLMAGTYNVDSSHSHVAFKVKHMMISNVKGQFKKFSGSFDYDENTNKLKSLTGTVDVNSIDTDEPKRDAHLKSADFFNVAKFQTMTFKLDNIKGDMAYGKLTIHGITQKVKMNLKTVGATIQDPWGNTRTGLSLSCKISRKKFGLKWNDLLETGGVMVGDIIKINVELEGILQH